MQKIIMPEYGCVTMDRLSLLSEKLRNDIPLYEYIWMSQEHRNIGNPICFSAACSNIKSVISTAKHSFDKGGCMEIIADIDSGCIYHCDDYCEYLYFPALSDLGILLKSNEEDKSLERYIKDITG